MNTTKFLVNPFDMATGLWGDLRQYDGIHWNCVSSIDAGIVGWYGYRYYNPPPLNRRFKRLIFTDQENEFFYNERLAYLKTCHFYMSAISQGLVIISNQYTSTESTIDLCYKAGFNDVKRIQEGCVLVHKY